MKHIIFMCVIACSLQNLHAQKLSWLITESKFNNEVIDSLVQREILSFDPSQVNAYIQVVFMKSGTSREYELIDLRYVDERDTTRSSGPLLNDQTQLGVVAGIFSERLKARDYRWVALTANDDKIIESMASDHRERWIQQTYWLTPSTVEVAVAQRIVLRPKDSRLGIYASIGDPDLGFVGGSLNALYAGFIYNRVKIYAALPIIDINDKRLNVAPGAGMAFESDQFGGRFQFGELTQRFGFDIHDSAHIYSLSTALQFYGIASARVFGDHVLRVKAGAVGYVVNDGSTTDGNAILSGPSLLYVGGLLRFEWVSPFEAGSYPDLESSLQAIIGNRSSVMLTAAWNITSYAALEGSCVINVNPESSKPWSAPVNPWIAARFRF